MPAPCWAQLSPLPTAEMFDRFRRAGIARTREADGTDLGLAVVAPSPGSGKSTRARAWVAKAPDRRCRVNRDDLRAMMHGARLGTDVQEQQTTIAQHAAILGLLRAGYDVVCDDTNLDPARWPRLHEIADQAGAEIETWDLTDVPVEECLHRNRRRTGHGRVPDVVITGMWADYLSSARIR